MKEEEIGDGSSSRSLESDRFFPLDWSGFPTPPLPHATTTISTATCSHVSGAIFYLVLPARPLRRSSFSCCGIGTPGGCLSSRCCHYHATHFLLRILYFCLGCQLLFVEFLGFTPRRITTFTPVFITSLPQICVP
ncbi:hypothetical protein BGW80DRAFT_1413598 [Lactifluus volemus]|nr:hypothetical protein BGW80DRAFT_1413598 [Lactifluus volemus]